MIDLRPNPTWPLHALSKTRRPPTRPRGHRIACASGRIRAIHRRIKGTEEEESGGSRRRPKSVILRVHAPSPWPWRRPFLRAGGSVRHRQTAGKTPPAQSSQPSAEELRARSRTGTLKFRRNPWHWRDRTHLRRTSAAGTVEVLGRSFDVDPHWLHRLVRVEVDLDGDMIRVYRLRRREPQDQPLLRELHHHLKKRRFTE